MEKIFITGVSGYLGQKLLACLCEKPGIKLMAGSDIREPSFRPDNFVFYRKDIREPLADILSQQNIDCLVHLAYVVPPLHDKSLMEDINVGGTKNVLDSCLKAGVKQIVYTSSATAYGFHADNDRPLTEESPLRGNDDFVYSKNKKEIEGIFNVGADGSMTFSEMIQMLGNRSLALPFGILYALNNLAWCLRLSSVSEFPSPALNMVRYPWIVSSEKLKNELGYRYKYTTRETFQEFTQAFKRGQQK